jgi:DUF4097 and DUF4098 domain-containing protein YvlB
VTLKCNALALALLLGVAGRAGAEEYRSSVDVQSGGRLEVDLSSGVLVIETHDAPRVEVEASAPDWPASWEFELTSDGANAKLEGSRSSWLPGWGARVRVLVPREYSLDLRTNGGGIEIDAVHGGVKARTSGGSIELGGATGDVELRTSGGSIRVADLHGDAELRTSGGMISAANVHGRIEAETSGGPIRLSDVEGRTEARTSGGAISVRFSAAPQGELRTSGGSIEVVIPPGTGADLEARTSGGRVELDRTLAFAGERSSSKLEGTLGPGGEHLELQTSGGNIEIRTR